MILKRANSVLLAVLGCINCALSLDDCSSLLEVINHNSSRLFKEKGFNRSSGQIEWCFSNDILHKDDVYWIEFDLKAVHTITAIEIDSVHKNNMSELPGVPLTFKLSYYRPVLDKWIHKWNVRMSSTGPKYILKQPIWASKIRISPALDTSICLSIQLYGCLWSEGLVSYTMPPNDIGDKDFYDGELENDVLKLGLGQLVDRLNETIAGEDRVKSWVGWHQTSTMSSIELVFEFDELRTFDSVYLTVDNEVSREVEVFKVAEVTFSTDGQNFSYPPICYHHFLKDEKVGAQTVSVNLDSQKGKFAKLNLYFKNKWIYLSEVKFTSQTNPSLIVMSIKIVLGVLLTLIVVIIICILSLKRFFACHSLEKKSKLIDERYDSYPKPIKEDDDYLKPRGDEESLNPIYESLKYGVMTQSAVQQVVQVH